MPDQRKAEQPEPPEPSDAARDAPASLDEGEPKSTDDGGGTSETD